MPHREAGEILERPLPEELSKESLVEETGGRVAKEAPGRMPRFLGGTLLSADDERGKLDAESSVSESGWQWSWISEFPRRSGEQRTWNPGTLGRLEEWALEMRGRMKAWVLGSGARTLSWSLTGELRPLGLGTLGVLSRDSVGRWLGQDVKVGAR